MFFLVYKILSGFVQVVSLGFPQPNPIGDKPRPSLGDVVLPPKTSGLFGLAMDFPTAKAGLWVFSVKLMGI